MIKCPEEREVKFATFLLQGSFDDWWTLYIVRAGGMSLVSWGEFRKVFQDKLYPCSFCDEKMNEFKSLVQGDMTITKYEKKYTELVKYALTRVIDELDKYKRFKHELKA